MSELERVRYDLLVGINMQTFAVICNSAVWAVSLCVSAHRHRVPFLGIQPSNVPSIGSLEQMISKHMIMEGQFEESHEFNQFNEAMQGVCLNSKGGGPFS